MSRVSVWKMKLVSWNVRGLDGAKKKKEVRFRVKDKQPFIVCLQETELQVCDDGVCSALWDLQLMGYSYRPSRGALGGLLTVWDISEVEVWSTVSFEHVLVIHGRFLKSNEEFHMFNVYAPCDLRAKQMLWDSLSERLAPLRGTHVCVCGDFNVVRSRDERRSVSGVGVSSDIAPFNLFIENNFLCDLPLRGRNFTWFKGDGRTMSRIDRFLLSEEWYLTWPNCLQVAQLRGLSDHCVLFLSIDEDNWGPRPSRFLKCWSDMVGYKNFVENKWRSFKIDGWGGYVLNKKFKLMRLALKEWHAAHSQNLSGKIASLKERLAMLDGKGEVASLTAEECEEVRVVSADILSLSRLNTSISWQQSRNQWLREGDANSKFFHSVLSSRRRRNALSSVLVDGVEIEGVQPVRHTVFTHFAGHFQAQNVERPSVANLPFRTLSVLEGGRLIILFSVDEVKAAVWDCDSFKSPGPDGVNFGFIKEFWHILKDDIMRFVSEFHRNGKLTKGINSTFISLIPKVDCPRRLNDFRPISLVGSMDKILAKLLANRLKVVLGSVVSESQSVFVHNGQILDGILIANEAVDEAKRCKKDLMMFKVDFEKAYDSVDWGYLDAVMAKMDSGMRRYSHDICVSKWMSYRRVFFL